MKSLEGVAVRPLDGRSPHGECGRQLPHKTTLYSQIACTALLCGSIRRFKYIFITFFLKSLRWYRYTQVVGGLHLKLVHGLTGAGDNQFVAAVTVARHNICLSFSIFFGFGHCLGWNIRIYLVPARCFYAPPQFPVFVIFPCSGVSTLCRPSPCYFPHSIPQFHKFSQKKFLNLYFICAIVTLKRIFHRLRPSDA